jgi:cytochrome c-type biogenesis protein
MYIHLIIGICSKQEAEKLDFDVGFGSAFLAGLQSFLTPCVLPIVPFYLCYLAGASMADLSAGKVAIPLAGDTGDADLDVRRRTRARLMASALYFAMGMITVFVLMRAGASSIGQMFRDWFPMLNYAAAAVIALLGLQFMGLLQIPVLYRQARLEYGAPVSFAGAYMIGLAFAFGLTFCEGPTLATISAAAGVRETAGDGAMSLLFYGAGITAPVLLAAAVAGPFLRLAQSFRGYLGSVEKGMGAVLVLFAALIATDSMELIAAWMTDAMPGLSTLG